MSMVACKIIQLENNAQFLSRQDYSYGGVIRTLPPEFVGDSPKGHCVLVYPLSETSIITPLRKPAEEYTGGWTYSTEYPLLIMINNNTPSFRPNDQSAF
jgi:hypothetical protein